MSAGRLKNRLVPRSMAHALRARIGSAGLFAVVSSSAVSWGALAMPVVLGTSLVVSAVTLTACDDESQPAYWIKKLNSPESRPAAIKRLADFYKDAMSNAKDNRSDPKVQAILQQIVKPMTDTYMTADLDEKTRVELLSALADTRDPGAKAAMVKCIADFPKKSTVDEVKHAATYVKLLKVKEAAGPLLDAFLAIKVTDPKTGPAYLQVKDAMLAIPDPSWTNKLIDTVQRPMDTNDMKSAQVEVYWQSVAAEILGDLKAAAAVKPLLKVLLTSSKEKSPVPGVALVSLVKMGKLSLQPAIDLLTGKDAELVAYAKQQAGSDSSKQNWYINQAASLLGGIGRAEAMQPMIDTLGRKDIADINRVSLAMALTNLPARPEAVAALQKAYDTVPVSFSMPDGSPGRQYIVSASTKLMDPTLYAWAIKQAPLAKTDAEQPTQDAFVELALKLMKSENLAEVKSKLMDVKDVANPTSQQRFKEVSAVMNSCGAKIDCYLQKIQDKDTQDTKPFNGIKSAYLVALLGGAAQKDALVKVLPSVKNNSVRGAVLLALTYLSPQGDTKVADDLQKIIDDNNTKLDQDHARQINGGIRDVVLILRARAS